MSANASTDEPNHAARSTPAAGAAGLGGDAEHERPLPRRSPQAAARRSALMAAAAAAGQGRAAAEQASAARRAKIAAAAGLPAALIAATTVALIPTLGTANAATGGACPAGQSASSLPSSVQAAAAAAQAKSAATAKTEKAVAKPAAPAHPTTAAPAPKPTSTPTASPSAPAASPTAPATSAKSTTTPPPNLLSSVGGLISQIFNPPAAAKPAVVNQLAAALAPSNSPTGAPSDTPTTPAPTDTPTSAPTTPAPTSSAPDPKPSASDTGGTSAAPTSGATSAPASGSTPTSAASSLPTSVCVTPMAASAPRETLWHLDADVLTLNGLTYNGVVTVNTANGPVNVLDFTADEVDVLSMKTYADNPDAPGKLLHNNGGDGKTVVLKNVHLHILKQTADLGLIDLEPGSFEASLLGIVPGVKVSIPIPFTGVHVDQYMLTSDTLDVPGFNASADK